MDYRDTEEFYKKREMRKSLRNVRRRRYVDNTKSILAYMFSLSVVFMLILIMVSQLTSCSTPPKLDAYEQHNADVEVYKNLKTLDGTSHNDLQAMWGTMYIEAQLNNMGVK